MRPRIASGAESWVIVEMLVISTISAAPAMPLKAGATLTGRVLDSAGKPVGGALDGGLVLEGLVLGFLLLGGLLAFQACGLLAGLFFLALLFLR